MEVDAVEGVSNPLLISGADGEDFTLDTYEEVNLNAKYDEFATERLSRQSFSSSFSALHPTNSAILTTFLLLNTMIGSGILNQPYVFMQSGIFGALLGFLITTIATWTALLCLTEAGLQENISDYSALAFRAFQRHGELSVDISIIIMTLGSQLGYILIVGTTLSDLLYSWGCNSIMCNDVFTTIVAVTVFVTPVCLFRHFGHLAYLSLFSIATIVSVLLLVFVGGPVKHHADRVSNDYTLFSITGLLSSIGSIAFSLECCSANFQAFISTEKKSRNIESWRKITGTAVLVGALMCASMGLVGYLSFADDTEGEILDNFPQHGYDVFKIMVVTHLILYIPVNFVIMRYSVVKVFLNTRSELLPYTQHAVISIALLSASTCVVIFLLAAGLSAGEAFSLILNITGGVGCSLEMLIIPAAIYLQLMPSTSNLYLHAYILLLFGVLVLLGVITITIVSYV